MTEQKNAVIVDTVTGRVEVRPQSTGAANPESAQEFAAGCNSCGALTVGGREIRPHAPDCGTRSPAISQLLSPLPESEVRSALKAQIASLTARLAQVEQEKRDANDLWLARLAEVDQLRAERDKAEAALLRLTAERDKLLTKHEHTWTCGCGWRNGVNLGTCAQCGRGPSDGLAVQDEDCIHAQELARLTAAHAQGQAEIESLRAEIVREWREDEVVARQNADFNARNNNVTEFDTADALKRALPRDPEGQDGDPR